jgi:trimeric autotransporter adhesin
VCPRCNAANSFFSVSMFMQSKQPDATSQTLASSGLITRALAAGRGVLRRLGLTALHGFAALCCVLLGLPANAQTSVSGVVGTNTHWTLTNSPYRVTGDVAIQGGAVLTIDAGVTIYMAAGTSLTVQSGGIQALGTSSARISVLSDQVRVGAQAAPGDWQHWVFNAGTVNTRVEHVTFEHGSGLQVFGAAPVLNHLDVRHQLGAAISIDLAASPTGVGNKASGNTVNGIAVPAGDVLGSVKWGMRGIPYVVSAGLLSIGASPSVTSIAPNAIQRGETITVELAGKRLAGISDVRFDNNGVTAQVLAGATDTRASLSVSAAASAALGTTGMRLLVDAGELAVENAVVVQQMQPTIASLQPSSLFIGQGEAAVIVSGRNFSQQSQLQVDGAAVATQYLSATELRTAIANQSSAANLSVRVRTPDPANAGQFLTSNTVTLPVVSGQLQLSPSTTSVSNGSSRTLTITLPFVAPAGGIALNVVSSVPSVAAAATTVTVPAGQSSATFDINAVGVGQTIVTVSRSGLLGAQAQVAVVPPPSLTLSPSQLTMGVGRTTQLTISSSVPATGSGLSVALSSNNAAVATLPSSVVIPSGSTSASVALTTAAVGTATIQAQANGYTASSTGITVRPVSLNLPAGTLVAPGSTRSIPLTLSDPAPAGGLTVALTSANTSAATVPAALTVAEGQSQANFVLTGVATGTSSISANATGYQPASMAATVESVTIGVASSISLPVEAVHTYAVTLSRPAPAGGVVANLAIADTSKATVSPSSITIAEGETSGGTVLANVTGLSQGTTVLSATSLGLTATSVPVAVTAKANLVFNTSAATVGKGLKTYSAEVSVSRKTGSSNYAPNIPVTVALTSGDSSKASVPATATIPAGQSTVYFFVTGVDLTAGTPVAVDAAATTYTSPATKLGVNVVTPVFSFSSLSTSRSPNSARDDFQLSVTTPGSSFSTQQTAAADMPIAVSIIDATPSGVVDGFYSALTGGSSLNQVLMKAGTNDSTTALVGSPVAAGSYKVQASAPGIATVTSPTVQVTGPELKFSRGSVTVGKGLRTYSAEVTIARAAAGVEFSAPEALTLNLTSSDTTKATVPATVTIPANQSSVSFLVTGVNFTGGTPVTVDAAAAGFSAPGTKLAVNVVAPVFTISSLSTVRSPTSERDSFYVDVRTPGATYPDDQAAASDLPIILSIVEATPAGIVDGFYGGLTGGTAIPQVLLKAGQTRSDSVYAGTPTITGTYKVQANATGVATTTSASVQVSAPALKFSRTGVIVGKGLKTDLREVSVARTVGGTDFNGAEALTVNLSSGDTTKVTVPAVVTIPANQASATFYVTGVGFTSGTAVSVDAVANGHAAPSVKLPVNVIAPVFDFVGLATNRSPASQRDEFSLSTQTPGAVYYTSQTAAADLPINLSFLDMTPLGVVDGFYSAVTGGTSVSQVVLKAGSSSSTAVSIGVPTGAGSYKVQANATGVATATSTSVLIATPELKFSRTGVVVGKGLKTNTTEVYVARAVGGTEFSGSQALTVNLRCSSILICNVPASVTIPAGSAYAWFVVEGVALGNTTITASAVGYVSSPDLPVSVVKPQLSFSGPGSTTVGGKPTFSVGMTVSGASNSTTQTAVAPITVNITSSSPGVATVPSTVTIAAGGTRSNSAQMTGVAVGTTTLTASGTDLLSATTSAITVSP